MVTHIVVNEKEENLVMKLRKDWLFGDEVRLGKNAKYGYMVS